jgi:hypothetical protein
MANRVIAGAINASVKIINLFAQLVCCQQNRKDPGEKSGVVFIDPAP